MKEVHKMINTTAVRGRLECANEVLATTEDKDPYKKELQEEITFLNRLLRYTDSYN